MKKEPHRLGATLGAAKAAEALGDKAKAKAHYSAAVALAENADVSTARDRGGTGALGVAG